MKKIDKIIEGNKSWSESLRAKHPEFFEDLSKQQSPEYLWIGCRHDSKL